MHSNNYRWLRSSTHTPVFELAPVRVGADELGLVFVSARGGVSLMYMGWATYNPSGAMGCASDHYTAAKRLVGILAYAISFGLCCDGLAELLSEILWQLLIFQLLDSLLGDLETIPVVVS